MVAGMITSDALLLFLCAWEGELDALSRRRRCSTQTCSARGGTGRQGARKRVRRLDLNFWNCVYAEFLERKSREEICYVLTGKVASAGSRGYVKIDTLTWTLVRTSGPSCSEFLGISHGLHTWFCSAHLGTFMAIGEYGHSHGSTHRHF